MVECFWSHSPPPEDLSLEEMELGHPQENLDLRLPVVCVFVRMCANYNIRHSAGWQSRAGKRQVDRKLSLSILSTETEDEWGSASMEKGSNSV